MKLKHDLVFETGADPEKGEDFRRVVGVAHDLVIGKLAPSDVKPIKVVAILADDFTLAVERVQSGMLPKIECRNPFTVERLGGQVYAKTMSLNPESSEVHIVFNGSEWVPGDGMCFVYNLKIAVHEMAHALLGRVRWQSGLLDGVIFPSTLPSEIARSIVRISAEEYWADLLAGFAVEACGSVTENGVSRPLSPTDLHDTTYRVKLSSLLNSHIHPVWANEVNRYRTYRQPMGDMWAAIVKTTDQIFTFLAHAESEANFLQRPGPLQEECRDHPGSKLYLGPAWTEISKVMKKRQLVFSIEDFKTCEQDILKVGQQAIVDMWGRLGLTFNEHDDRTFDLWVDEPLV